MKPPRRPSRRLKVRKCFARSRTEIRASGNIRRLILAEATDRWWRRLARPGCDMGTHPLFFWKCVKRKGFKSFVLKVCETKGVADAFLVKCVNLKSLGGILGSFEVSRSLFGLGRSFFLRS